MPESIQHKLDRVRSPRVQITYDVETGGAIAKTELPLVVGVLANLSGDRMEKINEEDEAGLPQLKDRKFIEIDRDNFNDVLEKSAPVLKKCGSVTFPEPLKFTSLDSFSPFEIVMQVAELKSLYENRSLLADLAAKLDGNEQLEKELKEKAKTPAALQIASGESK
jgi:type VI secretion system protein ImpB